MKKVFTLCVVFTLIIFVQAQPVLWGTGTAGGANGGGTIFNLNSDGSNFTADYNFGAPYNVSFPYASLCKANNGLLYGMTSGISQIGGIVDNGYIFSLNPLTNAFNVVYAFNYSTGAYPYGSLIQANDGLLYGMTQGGGSHNGGSGNGVIFSFDPSTYAYTQLYAFINSGEPYGSLLQASDGQLYGMTSLSAGPLGGAQGGNIFSYNISTQTYTNLYGFPAGAQPQGSLVQASGGGLLYGMTEFGDPTGSYGNIFTYDITGPGYSDLYDFTGTVGPNPGANPFGDLFQASDGNFYGLTSGGGTGGLGVLFSFTPGDGNITVWINFDGTSGATPYGNLIQSSIDGNLYGMTQFGINGYGNIFSIPLQSSAISDLVEFDGSNNGDNSPGYPGTFPYGSMVEANNGRLYGMTVEGDGNSFDAGTLGYGNLFYYDLTAPNAETDLIDFGYTTSGSFPYSMLQASNGLFYGLTNTGGTDPSGGDAFFPPGGGGVMYSYNPATGAYTELAEFTPLFSSYVVTNLMQASNGLIYGLLYYTGPSLSGSLFSIDPASNTYTDLYDFTGGTDGANPSGALLQANNGLLYGMTLSSSNSEGVIFSFDPSTNTPHAPVTIHTFDGTHGGQQSCNSLIQASDGLLYGMTNFKGAHNKGVIFSCGLDGSNYKDLYDFTGGADGGLPFGSLVQAKNGILYGMTTQDGSNSWSSGAFNGAGVLFSFNPAGSGTYNTLFSFDGNTGSGHPGSSPHANLLLGSDGNLYGTTQFGGANSGGVVFKYDYVGNTYTDLRDLASSDGTNSFSTPIELHTTTNSFSGGPFCAGAGISVDFSTYSAYTYNGGNVFTAQLSDVNGYFGSPVDIGTLTGTTSGTISATIPSNTTAGTKFRIRVESSNSVPLGTGADNGTDITINSCATINTWLGTTNDWGTNTNWSLNTVPSCSDVTDVIPATSNNPVISSAAFASNLQIDDNVTLTVNAALSVCGNLTGGSSSAATVQGNTALTLTGTALQTIAGKFAFQNSLALDNTFGTTPQAELSADASVNIYDAVVLQNDNTLDASLGTLTLKSTSVTQIGIIDNFSGSNSGIITGNITAERFYGSASAANDFKQHMLGSPVSGINLSALGSSSGSSAYYIAATGGVHNCNELLAAPGTPYGNVFSYDETHANLCTMDGWKVGAASTAVSAGTGYSVVLGNGSGTIHLTGAANLNSSYSVPTTNTGYSNTTSDQGRVYSSGINLVSNPYSATLDVSNLNTANSADFNSQTVYVWNVATGSYDMNPATIAPFQAFKVIQSAAGASSYSIPGTARTTTAGTFQRTANPIELNMTVTNNGTGLTDNTIVGFNPNSTAQFDAAYDVIKLPGALTRHTMYTLNSNYWLAVNVLKSINETSTVPVGFEPGVSGTYTADFSGLSSFDPTSYIMLEDKQTGTMFNIRSGDYPFTSDASDNFNRFVLHFTPPASINTTDNTCSEQGMINIIQPGTAIWNYTLADNNNVILSSGTLNVNSPVTASLPAGVYTLTLVDNNGYTVVKTIQVNGVQPVLASFTASSSSVNVNQQVSLSSTSAGAVLNSWNFGDGTTDNGATVSHSYANEGVYNVTLNSTSASGCNSSASNTITVTRSATGLTDLNDINNILIWSNEDMVNIDFSRLSEVQANIEIYNILGQKLYEDKYVTSTVYHKEIPTIEEGYIVVSVKNNDEIITRKLFIANDK